MKHKNRAYAFCPAAVDYTSHAGLGIYIAYKRNKHNSIRVREVMPNHAWIECPDRDIVLVRDSHKETGYRPLDCNFDEYVDFDVFKPSVAKAFGLDIFMTNSHHSEKQHTAKIRRAGRAADNHIDILTDSGGFQIIMQKVDYIDPIELVKHYNLNSDIGMVLDIPTFLSSNSDHLIRAAKIQAANTQLMMDNKRESLELMNVVHGYTKQGIRKVRAIVEREDITRLAIPGTADDNSLLSALDLTLDVMMTGQKYEHYHCLGIYNIPHMLPMILAANMPQFEGRRITSDASTHLQSANNKIYHTQHTMYSPARRIRLGDLSTKPAVDHHLPCSCPVCASIKYTDVLSVLDGALFKHTLAVHNMWEITRYSKMMNEFASTLPFKDFREVCRRQLANHDMKEQSLTTLDFVHDIGRIGIKDARLKYRAYMNSEMKQHGPVQLFGPVAVQDAAAVANTEYTESVLQKYEGGLQHKSKKMKGRKKQESTQRVARGARKLGKQKPKKKKKAKKGNPVAA